MAVTVADEADEVATFELVETTDEVETDDDPDVPRLELLAVETLDDDEMVGTVTVAALSSDLVLAAGAMVVVVVVLLLVTLPGMHLLLERIIPSLLEQTLHATPPSL